MVPSYIWLALVAMLCYAIADFAYGSAVRRGVSAATMTSSQACFVFPATAIWAWLEGTYVWTPPALLGAAAGALVFTGFLTFMRSVRLGEASISTPIYRISFAITALIAIMFLGEPMTLRKGIGFLLAGTAIFFISDFHLGGGRLRGRGRSILWAIASMFAVGLLNIVYKLGVAGGVSPAMFLHAQAVFFICIAFGFAYFTQGGPRFSRLGWAHSGASGLSFIVGIIAMLTAFQTGEASVVTPIVQLSFVVTVLMATWWMGERFSPRKLLGLAFAICTIAAFAGG